jgi:hypothetical protein
MDYSLKNYKCLVYTSAARTFRRILFYSVYGGIPVTSALTGKFGCLAE